MGGMILSIYTPAFLYAINGAMFTPLMHSFIYRRTCQHMFPNLFEECNSSNASRIEDVHREANYVTLLGNIALSVSAMLSSTVIGRLGDRISYKIAIIIPFTGALIANFILIIHGYAETLSPYYWALSELVFGLFGGFNAIQSTSFAYLCASGKLRHNETERSAAIARMEGTLAAGSLTGFLISAAISGRLDYNTIRWILLATVLVCLIIVLMLEDVRPKRDEVLSNDSDESLGATTSPKLIELPNGLCLFIIFFAFASAFFVQFGTHHILFFYLKLRFSTDASYFSILKFFAQLTSTIAVIFIFPILKRNGLSDSTLAVVGLSARALGRVWIIVAWDIWVPFVGIVFDMFSRYSSVALRSLLAKNVDHSVRGTAYGVVGSLQSALHLITAIIFHLLYAQTIKTHPDASFALMAVSLAPAILIIIIYRSQLEQGAQHSRKPWLSNS